MKTVLEIVQLAADFLKKKDFNNPRRQAEELIGDALGLQRLELYLQFERPLTDAEVDLCRSRLSRRAKGEPAQYIHGEVEFSGCKIQVNPSVLIPRQETEILAQKIIKQLSTENLKEKRLLDLCCGSGYIAIAIKKKFPELTVFASDISIDALKVAKENALKNNVAIEFLHGDLLKPLENLKFDYVVCNPPYVSEKDYIHLDPEVKNFEPRLALVGGESGLEFYQRLAADLSAVLNPHSKVWFEIGTGQGPSIKQLFSDRRWTRCEYEKDWSGHDRFFFLEIE